MFGFKDVFNKDEIDLENADKFVNQKGIMGALMRSALGEDGMAEVNEAIQMGQQAEQAAVAAAVANAAVAATAKVLNITGGNTYIMGNPLVTLSLEVHQEGKEPYAKEMESVIPMVQMPRIGDTIKLGNNPNNPNEFLYLGIQV